VVEREWELIDFYVTTVLKIRVSDARNHVITDVITEQNSPGARKGAAQCNKVRDSPIIQLQRSLRVNFHKSIYNNFICVKKSFRKQYHIKKQKKNCQTGEVIKFKVTDLNESRRWKTLPKSFALSWLIKLIPTNCLSLLEVCSLTFKHILLTARSVPLPPPSQLHPHPHPPA